MFDLKSIFRRDDAPASVSEDVNAIVGDYRKSRWRKCIALIAFIAVLILSAALGMGMGSYKISFTEIYGIIWDRLTHYGEGITSLDMRVIWEQRLPRVLTAIVVGAGFAAAGAAMQSMLKNPLADPYTTGISSGAAFGATLAITLGICIVPGNSGIVINAFVLSLIPAAVIVMLSTFKKASPSMMILAGISVMYIFNALTSYFMLVADENKMAAAYEWTVGTLNKSSWDNLPLMAAMTVMGVVLLMLLSKFLNAMNSGDSYARTLGINVERVRIILLTIVSIVAATLVSFTGVIGFVGLVAPHMARIFLGSDNKFLIPGSMLVGATVLVASDILAKAFTNTALPIGIVTSLMGGPLFLFLILRQKKEVW